MMASEVGDTVLYHMGSRDLTVLARVTAVDPVDGDVDVELGPDHPGALDVKKGQGPHTYEPLDEVVDWTLEPCPSCGSRRPNGSACPKCGHGPTPPWCEPGIGVEEAFRRSTPDKVRRWFDPPTRSETEGDDGD